MPLFEFECNKCNKVYDDFVAFDKTGNYNGIVCPHCGCEKKTKLISSFGFNFKNPQDTSKWTSESQGHDYRYKTNLPNVIKQREDAQKNDHMGADPYTEINDLDNDNAWDFDKA